MGTPSTFSFLYYNFFLLDNHHGWLLILPHMQTFIRKQSHARCSEISVHFSPLSFQVLQWGPSVKGKGDNFLVAELIENPSKNQVTKAAHRTNRNRKTMFHFEEYVLFCY